MNVFLDKVPVTKIFTDDINTTQLNSTKNHENSETESDDENTKVAVKQGFNYLDCLQKQSFVSEQ